MLRRQFNESNKGSLKIKNFLYKTYLFSYLKKLFKTLNNLKNSLNKNLFKKNLFI